MPHRICWHSCDISLRNTGPRVIRHNWANMSCVPQGMLMQQLILLILSVHAQYVVSSVCVCVCVCIHLTSGVSVHPENTVMYSTGNGGQKGCGVFSKTAPLQRSSTPSFEKLYMYMYGQPFSCRKCTCTLYYLP